MKLICRNENGISIVTPIEPNEPNEPNEPTVPFNLDEFIEKYNYGHCDVIDDDKIPANHFFRDAWDYDGNDINIDIEKAKSITKNRLRLEREPLFRELDIQFQRALEDGLDTISIVEEKNRLRNITDLVDSINNLDELNNIQL